MKEIKDAYHRLFGHRLDGMSDEEFEIFRAGWMAREKRGGEMSELEKLLREFEARSTYHDDLSAVCDAPRLVAALRKAIEQRDETIYWLWVDQYKRQDVAINYIESKNAQLAAILRGEG